MIECRFRWSFLPLPTYSEGLVALEKAGKWGFINTKGKVEVPFVYDWAGQFSEGLAVVAIAGKYGYINKAGRIAIPVIYDEAGRFSEGLAPVNTDHKWKFIDSTGTTIIEQFNDKRLRLNSFSDGFAVSTMGDWDGYDDTSHLYDKYIYIYDKKGECVKVFWNCSVSNFSNGLALVVEWNDEGQKTEYYIGQSGEEFVFIEPGNFDFMIRW